MDLEISSPLGNSFQSVRRFNLISKKRVNNVSINNKIKMSLLSQLKVKDSAFEDSRESYLSDEAEDMTNLCKMVSICESVSHQISTASEMEEEDDEYNNNQIQNNSFLEGLFMQESRPIYSSSQLSCSAPLPLSGSSNKNLRLLSSLSMRRFFEDEEEEYFRQLEDKINDWLDGEGVQQVEPNCQKKMNQSKLIKVDNPLSSSLIARRKLRCMAF